MEILRDMCGAKAIMITPRDAKTCQIIDDGALRERHHSPFVVGFKPEEMVYYIQNLREKDIWADHQAKERPFLPIQMSTRVASSAFEKTELGQWCASQGINDTIVVQIAEMSGYWTALNVFFDGGEARRAEKIFAFLDEHLEFLRGAWAAGRSFVRLRAGGEALLRVLSDQGVPACRVDRSGRVSARNDQFDALRAAGVVQVNQPAGRLAVSEGVDLGGLCDALIDRIGRFGSEGGTHKFTALSNPVSEDPLYDGLQDFEYF